MRPKKTSGPPPPTNKLATGIAGFDALSHGGLARGRTSLVIGGPGAGQSLFAMQTLVNAARLRGEAGIFVAFEEPAAQIIADTAGFDWNLPALVKRKLCLFEARLSPDDVHIGAFDLRGMLAMLDAKRQSMDARWIVFDGIDVLLRLLNDPLAELREVYRIRDWLASNHLTALVTAKADSSVAIGGQQDGMQFMTDCVIGLSRRLEHGVPLHRIQITKYRGSDFVAGEYPVSVGRRGMEVGGPEPKEIHHAASTERVSAGFERLDTLLGGGLFRGSSTLITGVPGTAKTTLAGKFAEAACLRGERTLFVSFDEGAEPIQRNLTSVGIALAPHVKSGLLRMYSGRTEAIGAEEHLLMIKALIREHQPQCMVIDPLSAIAKAGSLGTARAVANRLIYMIKDERVTVMVTSINEDDEPHAESTELQVSAVADTWIHLSYLVHGGERNRALTIIKSRGTRHSNQVRELLLSEDGPMLADVYTAGGEVLMGALRWEKERQAQEQGLAQHAEFEHKRARLEAGEAETRVRIVALQRELEVQLAELKTLATVNDASVVSSGDHQTELRRLRSADRVPRARDSVKTDALTKSRAGNSAAKSGRQV